MEKVNWKVSGMSCTNCALTIDQYLQEKGMDNVRVNFIGGDISFELPENIDKNDIQKGIDRLGYQVKNEDGSKTGNKKIFTTHLQRFAFCAIFTIPLMLHMIPGVHIHVLMNPYVQLVLTIPVFFVGMDFFGRSGLKSLLKGVPNMNVLVAIGALASFVYSLYGTLTAQAEQYLFYETTATIITLVFLGNWMEDKSVQQTQTALNKLVRSQKTMANMIAYDNDQTEHIFPVESTNLKVGDLVLIKSGEAVPMDCKILSGEVSVDEAIVTGESIPVEKKMKDHLIGGSIIVNGSVKAYITAVGEDSVLGNILQLVKNAQTEKPPMQQLADKISAIFVPIVIGISVLTLLVNYGFAEQTFTESLMRSIAVLVISCPCAMGLATPAAIAVGLGRAAKNGILFKSTKTLELFNSIQQVVFDKTGTLTTGQFTISGLQLTPAGEALGESEIKRIACSLEKYSNHPLAKAIVKNWKVNDDIRWKQVKEEKGLGVKATDKEGNEYIVGSYKLVETLTNDASHNIYLLKNNILLGWIDLTDEIRPEAFGLVKQLQNKGIQTILISGDTQAKCDAIAKKLGIDIVFAEQTPEQKLVKIASLSSTKPTAMVGDGINDAPALAQATVGVSLSEASQIAVQSASVVLMNNGLKNLPLALGLGKHTYLTIKQNLFWALIYNVVAIPVAAFGFLSPTIGALVMGLSDVVLAINSVRLNFKKYFSCMPQPIHILQQYWKHDAFRPLQEEIIQSVLNGTDTLALLPTGGGKSICFQVPALLMDGLCLVISPLIALMLDQVDSLKQKGISAAALHSGLTSIEVKQILLDTADGRYKFLYCSPERLESKLFAAYLPVLPIRLLVIDEAHCISQWGYDFRPPYLRIAATRKQLPQVTLIALTASATPLVQQDIIEKLNLQSTAVFRQSFERPNISYSNFLVDSKINKIISILQKVDGSSIVYCNNRRQTKKIAEALLLQGISADYYHAGLPQELREVKQQNWIQHKCRVMVCTNAFGMGIDKPDVRIVIHHDTPDCIENYYQEAGRAGRDDKKAFAVLLYQQKDLTELVNNTDKKFPPIPIIKEVYQGIADYLQIPVGNGEGIYYDIDFTAFVQNFKLDPLLVMNVLRVLEQEGHIQFADHIFLPTQVSFTATKEALYLFEENFSLLEPLIKALLRTYEGIIDNRVSVFEQTLAKICRITTDEITLQLKQLQQHGIIEYLPKKETPQIHFLANRAPAAYLHIQQDAYLQRKKRYDQRVQTMVQYANELTTCRSKFIANYFGDTLANKCGVCDNCLAVKRKTLSEQEFSTIEKALQKMGKVNIPLDAFFLSINTISKEKVWTVLNCLQSEDKIFISETKKISWLPKAKLSSTASGSSPTA